MVTVRVSETYDLSTKVNKMGLVGIHTPRGTLIDRLWGGLTLQYKKFRFVSCDVAMACASMLPADPLQVGVEAGSIAPQDLFNPILYKAVSNDSMSNILSYLQSMVGGSGSDAALNKGSIVDVNDTVFSSNTGTDGVVDQFEMYYSLLADNDNWRKAMPQAGLVMKGLYPLVYQVVNTYGSANAIDVFSSRGHPTIADDLAGIPAPDAFQSTSPRVSISPHTLRGPSMRMPSIDTTFFVKPDGEEVVNGLVEPVPPAAGFNYVGSNVGAVPACYVGLIVLPPAKLNQLYYRLKVTWTIEFSGLRSLNEITTWESMADAGSASYGTDYDAQSTAMTASLAMADTNGADITKIMEGR